MIKPGWTNAQKARECARLVEEYEELYGIGQQQAIEKKDGPDGAFYWARLQKAKDFLGERDKFTQQGIMYGILAILDQYRGGPTP